MSNKELRAYTLYEVWTKITRPERNETRVFWSEDEGEARRVLIAVTKTLDATHPDNRSTKPTGHRARAELRESVQHKYQRV